MSPQTNYSLLSEAKPYSKTAPNNNNDFSVLLQLGCIPLISFILRYLLAFCCVMVCQMTAFSCGLAGGTIQNFLHLTITLFLLESIYSNLVLLPWREVTKLNDFFYKPRFRKRILRSSTAHEKFPSVETTSWLTSPNTFARPVHYVISTCYNSQPVFTGSNRIRVSNYGLMDSQNCPRPKRKFPVECFPHFFTFLHRSYWTERTDCTLR